MPYIADAALDAALNNINDGNRVDICSQEPANVTEATSTYTLGNKTSASVGSPTAGDTSGRKVTISAITDGSVTSDGTASHWALSHVSGTELKAAESLTSTQSVTNGNDFSLGAIDIEFPDPT
jgi:hypothetical protein